MAWKRTILSTSAAVIGAALGAAGCTGGLFDEDFLVALGLRPGATNLPGEAPAVVMGFENLSNRPAEWQLSWRDSENAVQSRISQGPLDPGRKSLFSEFCPIPEITLGDVSDLQAFGVAVRLSNGGTSDAFVEVEPFGILLQEGINYECGDRVVFSVRNSNETLSGFRTFVSIERSGAQSTDPNQVSGG